MDEQLLSRAWVIMPLPKGSKRPATEWKSLQTDPDALEQSHAFFTTGEGRDMDCNVAIVTGKTSGVFVIDIDPHHMEEDPDQFYQAFRSRFPTNLVSQTPRGGWHLYYRYPLNGFVGQSRGRLPKGVDVRGQGGYVLAPPS